MRQKKNGFTRFVRKLDGLPEEVVSPVDRSGYFYRGMIFSSRDIRRFLDSVPSSSYPYLREAFYFTATPQGSYYWHDISSGCRTPSEEDIDYCRWLLEEYEHER